MNNITFTFLKSTGLKSAFKIFYTAKKNKQTKIMRPK